MELLATFLADNIVTLWIKYPSSHANYEHTRIRLYQRRACSYLTMRSVGSGFKTLPHVSFESEREHESFVCASDVLYWPWSLKANIGDLHTAADLPAPSSATLGDEICRRCLPGCHLLENCVWIACTMELAMRPLPPESQHVWRCRLRAGFRGRHCSPTTCGIRYPLVYDVSLSYVVIHHALWYC
jgi:hypothetical protein